MRLPYTPKEHLIAFSFQISYNRHAAQNIEFTPNRGRLGRDLHLYDCHSRRSFC